MSRGCPDDQTVIRSDLRRSRTARAPRRPDQSSARPSGWSVSRVGNYPSTGSDKSAEASQDLRLDGREGLAVRRRCAPPDQSFSDGSGAWIRMDGERRDKPTALLLALQPHAFRHRAVAQRETSETLNPSSSGSPSFSRSFFASSASGSVNPNRGARCTCTYRTPPGSTSDQRLRRTRRRLRDRHCDCPKSPRWRHSARCSGRRPSGRRR